VSGSNHNMKNLKYTLGFSIEERLVIEDSNNHFSSQSM